MLSVLFESILINMPFELVIFPCTWVWNCISFEGFKADSLVLSIHLTFTNESLITKTREYNYNYKIR